MTSLTPADRAVIEFLSSSPRPIRELLRAYPKATIYARLRALQGAGLVAKRGSQYLLTTAGLQVKAAHDGGRPFDGLLEAYPPPRAAPPPHPRAPPALTIPA